MLGTIAPLNMLFPFLLLLPPVCVNIDVFPLFSLSLAHTHTHTHTFTPWTLKSSVYLVITFKQNVVFLNWYI